MQSNDVLEFQKNRDMEAADWLGRPVRATRISRLAG
jgi:hypothetical protein